MTHDDLRRPLPIGSWKMHTREGVLWELKRQSDWDAQPPLMVLGGASRISSGQPWPGVNEAYEKAGSPTYNGYVEAWQNGVRPAMVDGCSIVQWVIDAYGREWGTVPRKSPAEVRDFVEAEAKKFGAVDIQGITR